MGARSAPTSPSAGADDSRGVTNPRGICCWCDDHDKEVSIRTTTGRYHRRYVDGSELNRGPMPRKFKIIVPLKTGNAVTVEIRFKVVPVDGATEADVEDAKKRLEEGVRTRWNRKLSLEIDDPECGKKTFVIEFKTVWATSGEHYVMNVHPAYDREGVTGLRVDVSRATSAWVYAHEFGHCAGLPDEYGYSGEDTETVRYIKPDGTLDEAISAPYNGKASGAADATIMAAHGNTRVVSRHGYMIAIEVQELLTSELGRRIRCNSFA